MRHRILIVEDEALIAADLADALSDQGYHIAGIVGTGQDALKAVQDTPVDLVLLDINLRGDLDGIQVASSMVEPRPPVVFLTAHGDDGTLRRAEHVEPAGYLVKPFEERTLYATVRMALYRSAAERERRARLAMVSSALDRIDRAVLALDGDHVVQLVNAVAEQGGAKVGMPLPEALTSLGRSQLLPRVRGVLEGTASQSGFELVETDHGCILILGSATEAPLCLCAWCHRARDDEGDWQEVESVLRSRYALELTHGICKTCVDTHFSDFTE